MRIKNPFYVKLGLGFLIIGLVGLVLPFVSFGLSEDFILLQQIAEQKQQEQRLRDQFIDPTLPILSTSANEEGQNRGSSISRPTGEIGTDPNLVDVANRLVIPGINIDMPIFASDNPNTLLKGGWVFPGTSKPGQKGNSVIFAHRFRYLPPITNTFYSLDKIKIGDTFTVAWNGVAHTYQVKEKRIIEPNDFSVLDQGSEHEMTLITCAPLFSTEQRLVVVGTLIK